jgi:anti-sigma regulatory factor (Ser/Thr protein kinase)
MLGIGGRRRSRRRLTLVCPPQCSSAMLMRRDLRAYLLEHSLDQRAVNEVVLAAEEALINAIAYAGDAEDTILVSAWVRRGAASVEVRDVGRGFDVRGIELDTTPDAERLHGRGLFLIHNVMDEVEITSGVRGTTVHMVRRLV